MRRTLLTLALPAALGATALTGCEPQSCTLVGCGPTVVVTLQGTDDSALSDLYTYEIVLDVDGQTVSTACGTPEGGELTCDELEGAADLGFLYVEYGQVYFELWPSENDLPEYVQMQVWSGDAQILDDTTTLRYEESFPNGEDCGACRSSSATFEIAPPMPME